jgi:hypothetical protein
MMINVTYYMQVCYLINCVYSDLLIAGLILADLIWQYHIQKVWRSIIS